MLVGKDRPLDESWRSGKANGAVLTVATSEDIHEAKVVVHEVFEQHRGNLRMVSATAQVCQEEAIALLLADQLDYDLLPAEAFAIGEEARDAHREYKGKPRKGKPADQRLKDAACTAKSKAKVAAGKDEALAAGLEQRLADIDERLATDRRELASVVPPLSWPAHDTVIHKPRPPTTAEAEQKVVTKWFRLEAAAKADEAAVKVAEQAAAIAACDAERAQKSHARLGECPTASYVNGLGRPRQMLNGRLVTVLISDDEYALRQLKFERWVGSQRLAGELKSEAWYKKSLVWEARDRARDARELVEAYSEEVPAAAWAAIAEAHEAKAAEAKAAQAAALARIAEMEARIAELELAERKKTRARLHADAEAAWGPDWQSKSPTAVHQL